MRIDGHLNTMPVDLCKQIEAFRHGDLAKLSSAKAWHSAVDYHAAVWGFVAGPALVVNVLSIISAYAQPTMPLTLVLST
jgi:hypothetical protein